MSTVVRVCTLVTGLKQGGEFSLLGIVSSVFMKLDFPGLGDNIHCIFACVDDVAHPHPPRCDVLMSNKAQTDSKPQRISVGHTAVVTLQSFYSQRTKTSPQGS